MTKALRKRDTTKSAKAAVKKAVRKARTTSFQVESEQGVEPALKELDQEITAIGMMLQKQIDDRAEARGYKATVFFRVVLNKVTESTGV